MPEPDPTCVVADVDVLVADLFVGGEARDALDVLRSHTWLSLVATRALLDEAEAVIADLSNEDLARDWREKVGETAEVVEPGARGHPALVAADAGTAATILTFDTTLRSASAGVAIRSRLDTSVKAPDAFVGMLDPAALYEGLFEEPYEGADRDPRA